MSRPALVPRSVSDDGERDDADGQVQERGPPSPTTCGRGARVGRGRRTRRTTVGIGLVDDDPVTLASSWWGCTPAPTVARMRVGVDTGGTFTDVVTADGDLVKVPSNAGRPGGRGGRRRRRRSRRRSSPTARRSPPTRCSNGKGAAVALVTNAGLEDVIEIGRQNRPSLYDQWADRPAPLVPRPWRLGVAGRLAADGTELEALGPVPAVPARGRRGRRVPAARRPRAGPRAGGGGGAAGRRARRHVLARGVARVPRVRAHGHDGGERLPPAGVPRLPASGWRRWRRRCG